MTKQNKIIIGVASAVVVGIIIILIVRANNKSKASKKADDELDAIKEDATKEVATMTYQSVDALVDTNLVRQMNTIMN